MLQKCVHAVEIKPRLLSIFGKSLMVEHICMKIELCAKKTNYINSEGNSAVYCLNPLVETIDKNGYPRGCAQAKGKEMVK